MTAGLAASALGQDSVPSAPGGNDALSPYESSSQRVRYVVDGASALTSWGNGILIAPVLKASRESDPLFRTLILGSGAASPSYLADQSFAARSFSVWSTPGAGVHPTSNSGAGTVQVTGFDAQLGIAASEFGMSASSILGATIGLDMDNASRLYVERVVAMVSRAGAGGAETATLSLGATDAAGNIAVRADDFNTNPATATRVLGENLLRINTAARSPNLNSLAAFGGANFASDSTATAYVVSNESVPTNTPTMVGQPGSSPFVLGLDFSQRFRAGSTTGNLSTTTAHLAPGIAGHRGNPTFSPFASAPGGIGSVASLARPNTPGAKTSAINVFDLLPGTPPTVDAASRRAFVLPSPVTSPAFAANASGDAEARQYFSQASFRGGNGQVGLGLNDGGDTVAAMVVTDPTAGDVLVTVTDSLPGGAWTVAAYPGQPVLNGPTGTSIGQLTSPMVISAPAVDVLGNVYFVARWQPMPPQVETGVFKSVPDGPAGHRLELLLTTGQQIAGPNSGRTYTISQLALQDGDSIASGALHSQQIIQQQLPGRATTDPESINAFGGLAVNAVLTYDNAGTDESYDAVLLLLPAEDGNSCAADFDNNGSVQVPDIFAFLAAWFAQAPAADFDNNGSVQVPDIFAFLAAWFAGC
jgi:hypothetical protein